jgi:hypothetical protein
MKVIFSVPDEGYSRNSSCALNLISTFFSTIAGADPEFQVRGGAHLIKNVGIFRVKNHDFTQKNHIFSNCGGRRENLWGISCEKLRFYAKKSYFFQF